MRRSWMRRWTWRTWTPRRWATAAMSMRSAVGCGWVKGWLLVCPWCSVTHLLSASALPNATKNSARIMQTVPTFRQSSAQSVRHLPLLSDHDLTLPIDIRCAHTPKPDITRLRPFGREVERRVGVDADDGGGIGRLSPGDGDGPCGRPPGRGARLLRVAR